MKICYLADANSVHTKKWCSYFSKKGYEITVISLNYGEIDGVKVISFNEKNLNTRNDISKLKYLNNLLKIREIVKKLNPDILHAHYATSYGLIGALINYHPYVISVWGSDVYDFPQKSFLHKKLLQFNLSKADLILSTSKVMSKETSLYTNKDLKITPFGVDLNVFKPIKLEKNDEKIIIGTVKTLNPKYGIDYLIRAFKIVLERNPSVDIELHIAGKGEQENELKELCRSLNIGDKVKFLGYLSQNKIVETFNSFDIAVFPSTLDSESFGVAAVEAQACMVPVIVSDAGGLPEATKPGYSSLVVKKKNETELADAIEKLIKNKELRIEMGNNGRKYVEENYDIYKNFNYVDELYKELLKGELL